METNDEKKARVTFDEQPEEEKPETTTPINMELTLTEFEYQKVEKGKVKVILPTEVQYFFQTHTRRAIKVEPLWTTWNKEYNGKDEEIYSYKFICVYTSFENKIEVVEIGVSAFEEAYYNGGDNSLAKFLIEPNRSDKHTRTEQEFQADLQRVLDKITVREPEAAGQEQENDLIEIVRLAYHALGKIRSEPTMSGTRYFPIPKEFGVIVLEFHEKLNEFCGKHKHLVDKITRKP